MFSPGCAYTVGTRIGSNTVYAYSKNIYTDAPARLVNGRVMLPLRVFAEAFGAKVDWDEHNMCVTITTDGQNGVPAPKPVTESALNERLVSICNQISGVKISSFGIYYEDSSGKEIITITASKGVYGYTIVIRDFNWMNDNTYKLVEQMLAIILQDDQLATNWLNELASMQTYSNKDFCYDQIKGRFSLTPSGYSVTFGM